ncbi:hypothetical protein CLD22_19465, partial [Rubrivivax gelatinosus]|nr:hypothetical protein [Rubrivivax gelatinosus]
MALARFADGIQLEYDEQLFSVAQPTAAARGPGGRRRGFSEAPQPLAGAPATGGAAAAIAERLRARGVVHRVGPPIQIGAGPAAPDRRRAAPAPAKPTRLTVPVAEGEQAVVLVEGDGVLAWRYGREAPASALAARRRDAPGAARLLEFDIGQPPVGVGEPPAGDLRRGWLRDRLVEGVRAIVLYFAAEATATAVVKLLERGRREGPVLVTSTDATEWRQPDDFSGVALPGDRQARVLLLVHGTFSSTVGGFGELGATPWGQRLLSSALQRYDAVLGFDHRSLSRTPRENAHALLQALGTLRSAHGIVADAVCHSRGGLVLRSLIEQELPASGLGLQVERAIFVAATNHGTELARPENWETLVDLLTNLGSVSAQALALFAPPAALAARIADEVFDCIGDFVKYLVQVAVKERRAPGIAAMDPGGDFVKELNERQPGQPSPAQLACYAVVSDFYAKLFDNGEHEPREMPKRLAFILADGVVDRLMRGDQSEPVPNDLVVDVASMTDIDRAVGGYVRDVLDYGRNPLVYHTNYFLRPETAARLAQWLKLPSPLDERVRQTLDGGQHSGLLRLPATAPMAEVRRRIESEAPNYLVFERQHPAAGARGRLYYALTPDEIRRAAAAADDWVPAEHALAFAETRASTAVDAGAAPTDRRGPPPADAAPSSRRGVVLAGRQVRAVL